MAGPGTGKTAVITERFRGLVRAGADPESILVLTFTERAAAEMRNRIASATGDEPPHVGTFHALSMRWLREDGRAVGVHPTFSILAGAERWIALRELMWDLAHPALVGEARPDDLVAPLLKMLERLKQELVPLARVEAWCRQTEDQERAEVLRAAVQLFRAFERRNRRLRQLDFDDVIAAAVRLLDEHAPIRDRYRRRYRHLMVDEYQDTDLAQERLVELLGAGADSVCVVGDDDQSIYRFRGASLASMNRFLTVFPEARTLSLGVNRRSSGSIVAVSTALIERNRERIPKALAAARPRGSAVEVLACPDEVSEAAAIADRLAGLAGRGVALRETAVLCRTNAVALPIAQALRARGVAVRHWGAQGLYTHPAVRDVLAMLRVVNDPDDAVALARLLARLGGGVEDGVRFLSAGNGEPALRRLAAWQPAGAWAPILAGLLSEVPELGAADLFFELMSRTGYLERPDIEAAAVAAVTRFGEVVDAFASRAADQSLSAFMRWIDLVLLSGYEEEVPVPDGDAAPDAVNLMTIHQSKGLEFEAVFVPAMVEGRLPQPHRSEGLELPPAVLEPAVRRREDHVAEERRLAYVAMTRARSRVYLSWAERYEGMRSWRPSRFLAEAAASGRIRDCLVVAESSVVPPARMAVPEPKRAPVGLSFSAVAAFRECPRQYWFRHRVGLAAPASMEAAYGSAVHAVLMRAGQRRREGQPVTPSEIERLLDEEWAKATWADPRRAPGLRRLAGRQLAAFLAAGGLTERPALLEHVFTAALDSWRLRGIIDRVDEIPPPTLQGGVVGDRHGRADGGDLGAGGGAGAGVAVPAGFAHQSQVEAARAAPSESERPTGSSALSAPAGWRLVDYKTGSALPASRLRRDLQLALYALGARAGLGLKGDLELEIVYLKDGKHVVIPATDELMESAREAAGEAAEAIRQERFEPRPERRRCTLCAYRLACDSAR